MILIDTCGWIEYSIDGVMADAFSPYFKQPQAIVVPTLVQFELFKWVQRERDEATALELIGMTEQGLVVPLTTDIALLAAELSQTHRLAMADAVMYATARTRQVELVTCDDHFADLAGVTFFRKPPQAQKTPGPQSGPGSMI